VKDDAMAAGRAQRAWYRAVSRTIRDPVAMTRQAAMAAD
jgi:hypothetical protein